MNSSITTTSNSRSYYDDTINTTTTSAIILRSYYYEGLFFHYSCRHYYTVPANITASTSGLLSSCSCKPGRQLTIRKVFDKFLRDLRDSKGV